MSNTKNTTKEETPDFSFKLRNPEIKTAKGTIYEIDLQESMDYLIWKSEKYSFFKDIDNLEEIREVLLQVKMPDTIELYEFQRYLSSLKVIHDFLNFLLVAKEVPTE